MVTARTIIGKRPSFPYNSRGWSILYFGTSCRGEFTTAQIKDCLRGKFPQSRNTDFLEAARKLTSVGLLREVKLREVWIVTEAGVEAMIQSTAYHRDFVTRTVGPTYIEYINKKIAEVWAQSIPLMEKLDREDDLLEQVAARVKKRRIKTSGKK